MASISGFFSDKAAEATNALKGVVDSDQPLTTGQRQRIEEVLCRAFMISVEDFRKNARNLETIRMEDSRKVIDGFYKHLRLTRRSIENCIMPLLDAMPNVKVCNFVECQIEKGALTPLLKKKGYELSEVLITRPLTDNESDEISSIHIHMPSNEEVREAFIRNRVAIGSKTIEEQTVKVVVNPHYLPDDVEFSQDIHYHSPTVEGCPERVFLMFKRTFKFSYPNTTVHYDREKCPYQFPGLPMPIRLYEDIGFGPVNLTEGGLKPVDPSKTEEDIELFVAQKAEELTPEVELILAGDE